MSESYYVGDKAFIEIYRHFKGRCLEDFGEPGCRHEVIVGTKVGDKNKLVLVTTLAFHSRRESGDPEHLDERFEVNQERNEKDLLAAILDRCGLLQKVDNKQKAPQ